MGALTDSLTSSMPRHPRGVHHYQSRNTREIRVTIIALAHRLVATTSSPPTVCIQPSESVSVPLSMPPSISFSKRVMVLACTPSSFAARALWPRVT